MTPPRDTPADPSNDDVEAALALVCTLPPLDREGRRVSVGYLLARATGWEEHLDGVLLEFPDADETVRALLDFVLAERQCCPHFTYEVLFVPSHERVTVRLRASGAYVAPLKAMYGELARDRGIDARGR